jgi:hypothetical protein
MHGCVNPFQLLTTVSCSTCYMIMCEVLKNSGSYNVLTGEQTRNLLNASPLSYSETAGSADLGEFGDVSVCVCVCVCLLVCVQKICTRI